MIWIMENLYNDPTNFIDAVFFPKWGVEQPHLPVIDYCLNNLYVDGNILEFGIWTGISTNFIAKKIYPRLLHAFDSFKGLEVEWNGLEKDFFVVDPHKLSFHPNVKIYTGYFIDTINNIYINQYKDKISFINIDCDLYSSTNDILYSLNDYIVPGTILYFDEIYNYPNYINGEYKSLVEWANKNDRLFRPIAYNDSMGVAVKVLI